MKATNKDSRELVMKRQDFHASNLTGINLSNWYIVTSYGWWILFAYDKRTNTWYENSERYSVSTSKQRGQAHPYANMTILTHDEIKEIVKT